MIIAVASGKGGTGKTTIATALAEALSLKGKQISFLDCDVEAPNAYLFLRPKLDLCKPVTLPIPKVDEGLCNGCGRCAEVCQYNAILVISGKPLIFPQLCHGCGSCTLICPEGAISEIPRQIGVLESGQTGQGIDFAHGYLNTGEALAVPVTSSLKKWRQPLNSHIVIIDSPPGTSCPVVASIKEADWVILVTEPTPFGLHDLKLAVELTQELNIPRGVIINRDGIGDDRVENYCSEAGIPILMRVPFDLEISRETAQGKSLIEIRPEYQRKFIDLFQYILEQTPLARGNQ
jgi:MinD superfamily P-loop ATPase